MFNNIYYFLLISLISTTIWAKGFFIEVNYQSKGVYVFLLILLNFIWIANNVFVYFKEKRFLIKLPKLVISTIIYLAIFLLNKEIYDQFSSTKLISYILLSTLIFEVDREKLKEIIFKSGILSTFIFLFLYLKAYFINGSMIYHPHHGRLIFFGPNPIGLGILITLIFISSGNNNIKKISNWLILSLIYTFLITIFFEAQSRTYLVIGFMNVLILLFFKSKEIIKLIISIPLSIIYLKFIQKIENLTINNLRKPVNIYNPVNIDNPSNIDNPVNIDNLSNIYNPVNIDIGTTEFKPLDNSADLLVERLKISIPEGLGGRVQIWSNCYDSLPSRIINSIFGIKEVPANLDCEKVSSHSVLIDIFVVGNFFKIIFYFISIYGMYTYFLFKSIYQKNILTLNLSLVSIFSSLMHNSFREPINLLILPIIFKLLEVSENYLSNKKSYLRSNLNL